MVGASRWKDSGCSVNDWKRKFALFRFRQSSLVVIVALAISMIGCSRAPKPVKGGTNGELQQAGNPIGDIQVRIYQTDGASYEVVGFADTNGEGQFQLLVSEGDGPLYLGPGEYCCTLNSVGSRIPIPKEYGKPETTPLKVSWAGGDETLQLELPLPKTIR